MAFAPTRPATSLWVWALVSRFLIRPWRHPTDRAARKRDVAPGRLFGRSQDRRSRCRERHGSLAVYKNASGDPAIYSLSDIEALYFCTYDEHGNLFAAGEHSNSSFALVELPKGAGVLREDSVNGTITPGYGLQWDGQHLALGAAQTSSEFVIDRIRVSGRKATVIGTTTLDASANSSVPVEFWIRGWKTIIQPQAENGQIGFWNYPAGGAQIRNIGLPGSMLSGVTVDARASLSGAPSRTHLPAISISGGTYRMPAFTQAVWTTVAVGLLAGCSGNLSTPSSSAPVGTPANQLVITPEKHKKSAVVGVYASEYFTGAINGYKGANPKNDPRQLAL